MIKTGSPALQANSLPSEPSGKPDHILLGLKSKVNVPCDQRERDHLKPDALEVLGRVETEPA